MTLSEPIVQPSTSASLPVDCRACRDRCFQRGVEVAVGDVQAEKILADLGGAEGHDRAADQPLRCVDDPHDLQRRGLRPERGQECRARRVGQAPASSAPWCAGPRTTGGGPASVTGMPRSASASAAIRPAGPVPATMIRRFCSVSTGCVPDSRNRPIWQARPVYQCDYERLGGLRYRLRYCLCAAAALLLLSG